MALTMTLASHIPFLFVILRAQELSATCLGREDQIQRYMISSEPPFDNYYNISKAVYPSVDLPSLLIKITVTFLATADHNLTNSSTAGADARQTTENETMTFKFTWSVSCLYVSGGNISVTSMNVFSLWAIYPNRRERQLHLTMPRFCRGFSSDTMIYFLSTLQDIAVLPHLHDPSLNTVECVTMGHDKASHFTGWKQLFHGVCWCILCISLFVSHFASQWLIVQLRFWRKKNNNNNDYNSKIVAVMWLSLVVFASGLLLICCAWYRSSYVYVPVFFGFMMLVLVRRAVWCIHIHGIKKNFWCFTKGHEEPRQTKIDLCFIEGHEEPTSTNIISCFILYPAVFMACHHLLWILLGIITEPFWGISVLGAVVSISAVLFFLTYELHKAFPSLKCSPSNGIRITDIINSIMCVSLIPAIFLAFVLLILVLLVISQSFLSESLISTLVQNGLVFFATLWLRYLKVDPLENPARVNERVQEAEGEQMQLGDRPQGSG